jgi:hypothetical protein
MQVYILTLFLLIGSSHEVNAEGLELKQVRGVYNGTYEVFGYNTEEFSGNLKQYANETDEALIGLQLNNEILDWKVKELEAQIKNLSQSLKEQTASSNTHIMLVLIIILLTNIPAS